MNFETLEAELAAMPASIEAATIAGDEQELLRLMAREKVLPALLARARIDEARALQAEAAECAAQAAAMLADARQAEAAAQAAYDGVASIVEALDAARKHREALEQRDREARELVAYCEGIVRTVDTLPQRVLADQDGGANVLQRVGATLGAVRDDVRRALGKGDHNGNHS